MFDVLSLLQPHIIIWPTFTFRRIVAFWMNIFWRCITKFKPVSSCTQNMSLGHVQKTKWSFCFFRMFFQCALASDQYQNVFSWSYYALLKRVDWAVWFINLRGYTSKCGLTYQTLKSPTLYNLWLNFFARIFRRLEVVRYRYFWA